MQLDHRSILVKDLEASIAFYRSVLGMDLLRTSGAPMTGAWLGADGKDIVHLNTGPTEGLGHVKDVHIALRTDRFAELIDALEDKSVAFESWQGEAGAVGRHALGFRQIYLQDPDGYWIEINDVDPGRKLRTLE
ncbi:lactoylglutathione lyase [Devosia yakushimensis]|uniref:Lactoylglutathione lyase n=1 Tax=Devosia yakushimensis TaxID=470028 RepID=A0ABQ5UHR4_9HYPH|nr:VOC family protein [Devosia yakushimensis]GLQ11572.1 lactoylglutathione lyase [Devosia yakushimensis]